MTRQEERVESLWRQRPRSWFLRGTLLSLGVLAAASWATVAEPGSFLTRRRLENLGRFLREDALPAPLRGVGEDGSVMAWASRLLTDGGGLDAALATLWISLAAMALAALAAFLLAPLGATSLMTREPFRPVSSGSSAPARRGGLPLPLLASLARTCFVLLRAIPEYVWAFLLLAMLPGTAWPAILALALHNCGILARLGADTIDNLPPAPLRALRAQGARRRELVLHAANPLALPRFLVYLFYRLETCVREATVLGMLGIASLGFAITEARARQRYDEMLLLVVLGGAIVLAVDALSQLARRRVRRSS